MTDEQFSVLSESKLAALLAEQIEAAVRDGSDGVALGPTDGALIAKALRLFATEGHTM
ncbi:hypothetical protein [Lichenibacterium dinghuense]|uniref:hypothetical protein n=1 Tax=Lichenibacterium dinghuense TaxID=2895977 RepID=UPI001F1E797A|nr:hypothetical protein [Lichenibacterium sp. 6Y81]